MRKLTVSEADEKRARIAEKIAASQERMTRGGPPAPAKRIPADGPPESLAGLVRQHPGVIVVGGLALGVAVGLLLPKTVKGKLSARAGTLAAIAGEIGLSLLAKADEAAREGREKIGELGGNASQRAGNAAASARSNSLRLAKKAAELVKIARP